MMRKQILGLLIISFLIFLIIPCLIPTAQGQKETISGDSEIESLLSFNKNIETAGDSVEIYWIINNYSKNFDKLTFTLTNNNDQILETVVISPSKLNQSNFNNNTGEYRKRFTLDEGKYVFVWYNGNDEKNLYLHYELTYNKRGYEESTGCYSSVFVLFFLSLALLGGFFINKKTY